MRTSPTPKYGTDLSVHAFPSCPELKETGKAGGCVRVDCGLIARLFGHNTLQRGFPRRDSLREQLPAEGGMGVHMPTLRDADRAMPNGGHGVSGTAAPERALVAWLMMALAVLSGCGGDDTGPTEPTPEPPRAAAISISPPSVTLTTLGETAPFTASLTDQFGAPFSGTIAWSSDAPEVFTVDANGAVTGVSNGSGTVQASLGSLSATATVTVAQVVSVIEVVSGDGQSGLTGGALPEPVAVLVLDGGGAPVAQTTVTFEPGAGHGTASPATAVSDANGQAQTTWTLGEFNGTQTLTASVAGGPSTTFTATAVIGPRVTLDSGAGSAPEGGVVTLGLTVDPVPESAISVRYTLGVDGDPVTSDADGSDYTDGGGGAVEIVAGASGTVIEIAIDDDDEIESVREVFTLTLDTPGGDAGYGLGVVATATVTIEEGVCDRTPQIRDEILRQTDVSGCARTENRDLARIQRLDLCFRAFEDSNCDRVDDPPITALREGDFLGLSGLGHLGLSSNQLEELPVGVFSGLSNLEVLLLGNNRLAELPADVFSGLSSLRNLHLSGNDIAVLPPKVFSGLSNLEDLYIGDNRLADLPAGVFSGLSQLFQLSIDYNQLAELPAGVFSGLSQLQRLDLRHNPGAPFTLALELRRTDNEDPMAPGPAVVELTLAEGAPVDMTVPLSGQGGALSANSVTLLAGRTASATVTMTVEANSGRGAAVVVGTPVWSLCEHFCGGYQISAGRPLIVANPATVSVSIPAVYLTQATQSLERGVPLIADRQALLRVFGTADLANAFGTGGGRAIFFAGGEEIHTASLESPVGGIPGALDEGNIDYSFNAIIPGHALQPGVEMVVEIDLDGVPLKQGSVTRFPAASRLALDVRKLPPMYLTIVPVQWISEANQTHNQFVADFALDMSTTDSEGVRRFVQTVLPVGDLRVNVREPYVTWGSTMQNGAFDLLGEIDVLRHMEAGREDEYYLGVFEIPRQTAPDASWPSLGELPGYVAVSWASRTIAHELGHNLSLQHAPCATTGYSDPDFPHEGASIGVWGHRFWDGGGLGFGKMLGPASHKDLMSYCQPWWISDYSFTKALEYRLEIASSRAAFNQAAPKKTLLLWGGIRDGDLRLEPAFAHDAPAKLPEASGPYQLEGLDAEGGRLFSLSFTPDELDHGGSSFLFAIPFEREWTQALDRVTLTGPEGSTTLDRDTGGRAALIVDRASGRVRTIARDWPDRDRALPAAMSANAQVEIIRGLPRR